MAKPKTVRKVEKADRAVAHEADKANAAAPIR